MLINQSSWIGLETDSGPYLNSHAPLSRDFAIEGCAHDGYRRRTDSRLYFTRTAAVTGYESSVMAAMYLLRKAISVVPIRNGIGVTVVLHEAV